MIKFSKLAIAAALAGGFAASAYAEPVSITTPNGIVSGITAFDWAPSPVLAQGGNQAFVDLANGINNGDLGLNGDSGNKFTVYSQGRLSAFLGGVGAVGNLYNGSGATANRYEITFELAYQEVVTTAVSVTGANIAVFDFAASQDAGFNYFNVYVKDLDSDAAANYAAGTGFNTGTLVFSGEIAPGSAGSVSNFSASTTLLGQLGGDGDASNGTSPLSGAQTVVGSGSTPEFDLLTVVPITFDPTFWNSQLTEFLVTNISQALPFTSVDPSVLIAGQAPNIGPVNGGTIDTNGALPGGLVAVGPDILFQTDFNGPVQGIPEPATLALTGLALGALSFARRRKAA
jgi:hypothetical protein